MLRQTRILVVEDDRATRHPLRRVLARAGSRVRTAAEGRSALRLLRARKFDLVLLDIWMPRMTGLELLERIRPRRRRLKVIVLTSDDTPETLLKAVREQAVEYVTKPVHVPSLLQTVGRALRAPDETPGIEVLSGRPNWVELTVPCTREAAERVQEVLARLEADLPEEVRESVGYAFRELLLNALEWGGRWDPSRRVRVAYLRARRMLLYRIADPGPGFRMEDLPHAAVGHPPEEPVEHMEVRAEKGLRPGGFGLLMVKAKVDELLYNEKQNEVVFVKYLDEAR